MAKMTGKQGSFSYAGSTLTITQWEAETDINQADTTASDCYDVNSNLVWRQQIPTSAGINISVEGPWNPSEGNTEDLALYVNNAAGNGTANCSLVTITNSTYFSGLVSVQSFTLTEPIDDTVTYSASLMSYGKPNLS